MHIHGMGDYASDMEAADQYEGQAMRDYAASSGYYYALPTAASPVDNPTASFNDWGQAISTAIKTWGQVAISQGQSDALKAQYTRPGYSSYYPPGVVPGITPGYPFPGAGATLFGIPANWLLIGAAGIAAVILTSGNGKRR